MKLVKISNLSSRKDDLSQYEKSLDADVNGLFTALKGRVRFGSPTDGYRGENISGEFQVFTSNGTPDTEDTVAHTIGAVPVGYIVLKQSKAGSLYLGTTSWTSSNVYFKSDVASIAFTIFLLK